MFFVLLFISVGFTITHAHILSNGYATGYHQHGYPAAEPYHSVGYHQHPVPVPESYNHVGYHQHPVPEPYNHVGYHQQPIPEPYNHIGYHQQPIPEPYHNAGYHQHIVPVGSTTNYVYPGTTTTNQVGYPSYHSHGYTHPVVSTSRYGSYGGHGHYGHGRGSAYSGAYSSHHYHYCRTTYGTWSAWGTCSYVHVQDDATTECGPGRQVRYRQRNQPTTTTPVSYYRVPYVRYPTCTASCAPAKELFQVQQCTVSAQVTCVEAANTMPLCDFDVNAADVMCSTSVTSQPTFLYKFTMTTNAAANDYLELGGSTGTLPLAVYWPTVSFPPSDNYKYCVKYKAKLDEGTMLFASYLTLPTTLPAADKFGILAANALLAADSYVGGSKCEGEGVIKCDIGTASTTTLASYQQEITVKEYFGIGLIMIPSATGTGTGYSSGQLDDIQVVAGGC